MFLKSVLFLTLSGIAIGLLIGIIDSSLHFISLENFKILNIITFILFFAGVYWSVIFLRNKFYNGLLSYGRAFRNIIFTGIIATFVISIIRYIYLNYIISVDIEHILNQTKETMLDKYSLYTDDQIYNRLSFIEFSYNPIISSLFYFLYYISFVIIFAFLASFVIRRIDRNISL